MEESRLRLDDLGAGYQMWQDRDGYCFGVDSVLLAHFASLYARQGDEVMDLCAGAGAASLLLLARAPGVRLSAAELDEGRFSLLERNFALNKVPARAMRADAGNMPIETRGRFDLVLANPPYFRANSGKAPERLSEAMARHEVALDLQGLVRSASCLLKGAGRFALVHRADRLQEILRLLGGEGLAAKEARFVYPKPGKGASLALVCAKKGGKEGVAVGPPLTIMDEEGKYTEEINAIYSRGGRSGVRLRSV
jgi:tRNA1(Val) A37 N6-methylase TrmN6